MKRQRGTTLLVVLVMLVVLTLLGIAGARMSGSSLQIVGNMQARKFVENYAQQAIEDVMNTTAPFNTPGGAVTLLSEGTTVSAPPGVEVELLAPRGIFVTVSARTCLYSAPAAGYSAVATLVPVDNLWEYSVAVRDNFTGATSAMVQGTRMRQLADSCP